MLIIGLLMIAIACGTHWVTNRISDERRFLCTTATQENALISRIVDRAHKKLEMYVVLEDNEECLCDYRMFDMKEYKEGNHVTVSRASGKNGVRVWVTDNPPLWTDPGYGLTAFRIAATLLLLFGAMWTGTRILFMVLSPMINT